MTSVGSGLASNSPPVKSAVFSSLLVILWSIGSNVSVFSHLLTTSPPERTIGAWFAPPVCCPIAPTTTPSHTRGVGAGERGCRSAVRRKLDFPAARGSPRAFFVPNSFPREEQSYARRTDGPPNEKPCRAPAVHRAAVRGVRFGSA